MFGVTECVGGQWRDDERLGCVSVKGCATCCGWNVYCHRTCTASGVRQCQGLRNLLWLESYCHRT